MAESSASGSGAVSHRWTSEIIERPQKPDKVSVDHAVRPIAGKPNEEETKKAMRSLESSSSLNMLYLKRCS